jgi:hypothetical protein
MNESRSICQFTQTTCGGRPFPPAGPRPAGGFPIILAAIGIVIVKWDYLSAKFEQATGWKESGSAASG